MFDVVKKIAVIVPVYKVEAYLRRCVDSILAQTYRDFELILVDDGSPDNCGRICDEYAAADSRVVAIHQQNGGLSAARNAGIDYVMTNCHSEWIAFIDSDDWVDSRYLEELHGAAVANGVAVSSCGFTRPMAYQPVDREGVAVDFVKVDVDGFYELCWEWEECGGWIINVAWGKMFAAHLFKDLRFPIGKLHEDVFATYKAIFEAGAVAQTKASLYHYFVNPQSIVGTSWTPRRMHALEGNREQIAFMKSRGAVVPLMVVLGWHFKRVPTELSKWLAYGANRVDFDAAVTAFKEEFKPYCNDPRFSITEYYSAYRLVFPYTAKLMYIRARLRELGLSGAIKKVLQKI